MACPHVTYRKSGDGQSFDTARAYCTVADRFVQPMRADICVERYDLDPATDCEIYREQAGLPWADGVNDETSDDETSDTEHADSEAASGETTTDAEHADSEAASDETTTDGTTDGERRPEK